MRIHNLIAISPLAFALFTGGSTAGAAERNLTRAEKAAFMAAVMQRLKDPESARFRWRRFKGKINYCGLVNAKNSFGGYTGFDWFWVDLFELGTTAKINRSMSAVIGSEARQMCIGDGYY